MVWMVALGSSISHTKSGHADKEVAKNGRITAVPAAVVGTGIAWLIVEHVSDMVIKALAAIILIFVIERNLRGNVNLLGKKSDLMAYRKWCSFGGLASGILGIGGGAIYVTLHQKLLGMEDHKSAGTSYMIGAAVVPVALISHAIIHRNISSIIANNGWMFVLLMPLLAFSAAFIGARFAIKHLPVKMIRVMFMIAVSGALLKYLWDIGENTF